MVAVAVGVGVGVVVVVAVVVAVVVVVVVVVGVAVGVAVVAVGVAVVFVFGVAVGVGVPVAVGNKMKSPWLLMAFLATWEVFFIGPKTFTYTERREFNTHKEMVEFIKRQPSGKFECDEPVHFTHGICEIKKMKPRLAKSPSGEDK